MSRMVCWTGICAVVGFVVFFVLFMIFGPPNDPDRIRISLVFSAMAAIPVAAIGSVFAAFSIIMDELNSMRRQMARWQMDIREAPDKTSTNFEAD